MHGFIDRRLQRREEDVPESGRELRSPHMIRGMEERGGRT